MPHAVSRDIAATVASTLATAVERLEAASIEDARLEAEVLLAHALRMDRAHLLARLRDQLNSDEQASFQTLIARRLSHEPLAYITGVREFYGIGLECSRAVLIPRPETELLVDIALEAIRQRGGGAAVADVGTGTGAIAVAIAANAPFARVTATDPSASAIDLARRNAARAGVGGRIEFRVADLLDRAGRFDLIVANLPYVSERAWRQLPPEIRDHEPRAALVGGRNGGEIIESLLARTPSHLAPRGLLAVELDPSQAGALLAVAQLVFPRAACAIERDLAGRDRALVIRT